MRRFCASLAPSFRNDDEVNRPFGNSPVASVGGVEEVRVNLELVPFANPHVLDRPKSRRLMPSARRMLRPALPIGFCTVAAREQRPPPAAWISRTVMLERSRFVFRNGRIEVPTRLPGTTPPGSLPFSTVKGAPDCSVRNPLTCQPPRTLPTTPCCCAEHRQLEDAVDAEALRTVVGGAARARCADRRGSAGMRSRRSWRR